MRERNIVALAIKKDEQEELDAYQSFSSRIAQINAYRAKRAI